MTQKAKVTSALKLAILRLKQVPVLQFENAEVIYMGEKRCAYKEILNKFMEIYNAKTLEIPSFSSSLEAILKCNQWFVAIKKCPHLKHQEKKSFRGIFYLTLGKLSGFDALAEFEGRKKNDDECMNFGREIISILVHENTSPQKNTPTIWSV
jgi:hypothetical protein